MKSFLSTALLHSLCTFMLLSCDPQKNTTSKNTTSDSFENNKNNQNKNRDEASCKCDGFLEPVYDRYDVTTDKQYLEALHTLFQSTKEQYNEKVDEMGISGSVPNYGSVEFTRDQKKIKSLYEKYKNELQYSLAYNEHVQLSYVIANERIRIASFVGYNNCMSICSKLPTLYVIENGQTDVIIRFSIPITTQNQGQKFKIEQITYPSNLTRPNTTDELKKDDIIQAGAERTLKFKRSDKKSATVSIDIKGHPSVSVELDATNTEYVYRWQGSDESGTPYKIIMRADIHYPTRTIELKNLSSGKTLKTFKMTENPADLIFETGFDTDSVRVNDIISKSTGAKTKTREYVIVKEGLLSLLAIVNYSKGISQIDYNVYFQKKKPVAVSETR